MLHDVNSKERRKNLRRKVTARVNIHIYYKDKMIAKGPVKNISSKGAFIGTSLPMVPLGTDRIRAVFIINTKGNIYKIIRRVSLFVRVGNGGVGIYFGIPFKGEMK